MWKYYESSTDLLNTYIEVYKEESLPVTTVLALPQNPTPGKSGWWTAVGLWPWWLPVNQASLHPSPWVVLPLPHIVAGLAMTCFGWWDICKLDASIGLKYICIKACPLLPLFGTLQLPWEDPGHAQWRMRDSMEQMSWPSWAPRTTRLGDCQTTHGSCQLGQLSQPRSAEPAHGRGTP